MCVCVCVCMCVYIYIPFVLLLLPTLYQFLHIMASTFSLVCNNFLRIIFFLCLLALLSPLFFVRRFVESDPKFRELMKRRNYTFYSEEEIAKQQYDPFSETDASSTRATQDKYSKFYMREFYPDHHLDDSFLRSMVNYSHDNACMNPFRYACPVDARTGKRIKTIRESSDDLNQELVSRIRSTSIAKTNFVKQCIGFHSLTGRSAISPDSKQERLFFERFYTSKLFVEQWDLIQQSPIRFSDPTSIAVLLGKLFQYGTRTIVDVTLNTRTTTPSYRVRSAPLLASGFTCKGTMQKPSQCAVREKRILTWFLARMQHLHPLYPSIDSTRAFTFEKMCLPTTSSNPPSEYVLYHYGNEMDDKMMNGVFPLAEYLSSIGNIRTSSDTPFYVNLEFLERFTSHYRGGDGDDSRHHRLCTQVEEWKNYLRATTVYYLMLHYRISGLGITSSSPLDTESLCIRQFEQLFPFHVCHLIRKEMALDIMPIKQSFYMVRDQYRKWILNESQIVFGWTPEVQKHVVNEVIDKIHLVADRCWLYHGNDALRNHLVEKEDHLLKVFQEFAATAATSTEGIIPIYEDMLHSIFHQSHHKSQIPMETHMMVYRNEYLNRYIRNLDETFMTWNAETAAEDNALVVMSGLIYFALKGVDPRSQLSTNLIRFMISHEIAHRIDRVTRSMSPPAVQSWQEVRRHIEQHVYPTERESNTLLPDTQGKDVFADWMASKIVYSILEYPSRTDSTYKDSQEYKDSLISMFRVLMKLWCTDINRPTHLDDHKRAMILYYTLETAYRKIHRC